MIRRPPRSTLMAHSFPTRRSSDLLGDLVLGMLRGPALEELVDRGHVGHPRPAADEARVILQVLAPDDSEHGVEVVIARRIQHHESVRGAIAVVGRDAKSRSEEHTSELQSLMRISYAVFCLKKITKE